VPPAGLWVCRSRANPYVLRITDEDESDSVYSCNRLEDLTNAARGAYYIAKLVALLR
jgi:hypothetical protein